MKTRTAMNAKISVFVICVEVIIYTFYYISCMPVPLNTISTINVHPLVALIAMILGYLGGYSIYFFSERIDFLKLWDL